MFFRSHKIKFFFFLSFQHEIIISKLYICTYKIKCKGKKETELKQKERVFSGNWWQYLTCFGANIYVLYECVDCIEYTLFL